MAYTPYYPGGWQSGEQGGTPITPAALNNMEAGIGAALTEGDVVNNLTSTATDKPLSANMGKALNDAIAQSKRYNYFNKSVTVSGGNGVIPTSELPSDFGTPISAYTVNGSANYATQLFYNSNGLTIYAANNVTSTWRIFYEVG